MRTYFVTIFLTTSSWFLFSRDAGMMVQQQLDSLISQRYFFDICCFGKGQKRILCFEVVLSPFCFFAKHPNSVSYKGSSINDDIQFWTIFDTPSPHRHAFIIKAYLLLSQNPWYPLLLRLWRRLWTALNT